MQHNVLDTVLQAFSEAVVGRRTASTHGLSAVPLFPREPPPDAGDAFAGTLRITRPPLDIGIAPLWREAVPAHPRRITVRNTSEDPVVVDAGTVFAGGMATRSVARTTVVPPHTEMTVAVEVIGARWWDEGELRMTGQLAPVPTALMLQACLGEGAGAASARTALWSLAGRDLIGRARNGATGGWLILEHQRVLAGWLAERDALEAREREVMTLSDDAAGADEEAIASLRRGLHGGSLQAHVVDHDLGGRDWIVVPRTFDLVDAMARSRSVNAA